MDRKDIKLLHGAKRDDVRHKMADAKDIRTHPTFVDLLRVEPGMLQEITQSMRVNGFFPSNPITMGTWSGQDDPVVIDGHTRLKAALEAGIAVVTVVILVFEDVMAALERAVSLQAQRRFSTDGAYYRMCETYDTLMEPGRKNKEANELLTRVSNFRGRSASARMTAKLIGCHYRKVDKIRKIRRDGWPEIQEAVRNDEMGINKAYKQIRDMELGNDDNGKRSAATHIKAAKTLLTKENFAVLDQLDGDIGDHMNKALEMYMRWLQGQESVLPAEHEPVDRQEGEMERIEARA